MTFTARPSDLRWGAEIGDQWWARPRVPVGELALTTETGEAITTETGVPITVGTVGFFGTEARAGRGWRVRPGKVWESDEHV